MKIKLYIGLALLGLVLIFILQNTEMVNLRFLFWQLTLSRALLLFMVFACGLAAGLLFGALARRPRKKPLP